MLNQTAGNSFTFHLEGVIGSNCLQGGKDLTLEE